MSEPDIEPSDGTALKALRVSMWREPMRLRTGIRLVVFSAVLTVFLGTVHSTAAQLLESLRLYQQEVISVNAPEGETDTSPFAARESPNMEIADNIFLVLSRSVGSLIRNKLAPNVVGLLFLLLLSGFFSTINFLWEHELNQEFFRRTYRYLVLWILSNYVFALIFLLLILPDDMTLKSITKEFFMYCLLVTALPEISTNLRLQLGKSERALDLHRYKQKVSKLITQQLDKAATAQKDRERQALAHCFADRLDQLREKLLLLGQRKLTKNQRNDLSSLLGRIDTAARDGGEESVAYLLGAHAHIAPVLLEFLDDDIRMFQKSPVGRLLSSLHPLLKVEEARALVEIGITTPGAFVRRCWVPFFRSRLVNNAVAKNAGLDEARVGLMFGTTRAMHRASRRARAKWAVVAVAAVAVISNLAAVYGDRLQAPDVQTEAEAPKTLTLEELTAYLGSMPVAPRGGSESGSGAARPIPFDKL